MQRTDEQQAILDAGNARGNMLVEALAGSGKSTALKWLIASVPQKSILICAFNKRIADDMEASLPPVPKGTYIKVRTFHATGLSVLKAQFPRLAIDKVATEEIINRAAGHAISFKMRRAAVSTLRMVKDTYAQPEPPSAEAVLALALEYSYFDKLDSVAAQELCVDVVRDAYALSLDFANRSTIDFSDMVWGPVALGIVPRSRFQAVFVDELQDISEPQLAMLMSLVAPGGRMILVGDKFQAIYAWRGANAEKMFDLVEQKLKPKKFPLTITWRCAKAIVKEANALVPTLRARPDAPDGTVQTCQWAGLPHAIGAAMAGRPTGGPHTFVLSRNNAMLLDCALYLWRSGTKFELNAGKDLLNPLFTLLDKLDMRTPELFLKSLRTWEKIELDRAEKANASAYAERIEEQAAMLRVAAQYAIPVEIRDLLNDLIRPNSSGVLLSSVHKVKGLEAERVFLLRQTFGRHAKRSCKFCDGSGRYGAAMCDPCGGTGIFAPAPDQENLNIEYVAITRAINRLIWVDCSDRAGKSADGKSKSATDDALDVVEHALVGETPALPKSLRKMIGIKTMKEQLDEKQNMFLVGEGADE